MKGPRPRPGTPRWVRPNGSTATALSAGTLHTGGLNVPHLVRQRASDGEIAWQDDLGPEVEVGAIVPESGGRRLLVTGHSVGTVTLAGKTFNSPDNDDVFVAGVDANTGTVLWAERPLSRWVVSSRRGSHLHLYASSRSDDTTYARGAPPPGGG